MTKPETKNAKPETALTPRQQEVLKAIASGKPRKQVADELGVTQGTLRIHVQNIFSRLNIHSITEAIRHAARLSLL